MNPSSVESIQSRLAEIFPSLNFYLYASPVLLLLIAGIVILLAGVFKGDPEEPSFTSLGIAVVTLLAAVAMPLILSFEVPRAFLGSGFLADGLSQFSFIAIGLGTLFTFFSAALTEKGRQLLRPEMACLLLFSSAGMLIMTSAGEFLTFFTGLELMSVSLYVIVGYQRKEQTALESALKYFILGATAAGVILMGMALVYLHTGTLRWADLANLNLGADTPFAVLGLFLIFCGLAFKLAIAPFHSWAPDVYQSSHSTLTGYMATLVKLAVAVVTLRILSSLSPSASTSGIVKFFWVVGAFSIVVGSTFGLVHNSVKRMLAYSSVANAGYFCLAFAALAIDPSSVSAKESLVAYTAIYLVLNLGAFAVLAWLEEGNNEDLLKDELAGLSERAPFAAVCFTVFLLGLAGIPPLAGFFGKFMLINAAVGQGLIGLSVIMVLASCLSLYYYLSLLVEIWLKPSSRNSIGVLQSPDSALQRYLVGALALASVVIGIVGPRWAQRVSFSMATEKPVSTPVHIGGSTITPKSAVQRSNLF